jgi:MFS family permease
MRRYLALARLANGPRLLAGSLLVAPGQAATDLVILLAVRHASGSFGPGGVAVAASTIAFSVSTLVQGRLIDRVGIRRVIGPAALGLATATAALAVALALGAAPVLLIALSAALGLSQPATGPAARTAWTTVATDADTRLTAFSYCSVTQDVGFVAGPALLGLVATAATPVIALACCGALIAAGALAISSATTARTPAGQAEPAHARRLLRSLGGLAAVMVAVGVALGAVDVSAPAFATQHGQPGLAGVLIAACSLGSLLGGVAYGARSWNSPVIYRLLACSSALGALLVLPALAPDAAAAAVGLLAAGVPMGATLTTAYLLAGDLVPESRTTVGFSLLGLALNGGAAAGYAISAQIAAHGSADDGFLLGASAAMLAACLGLALRRTN